MKKAFIAILLLTGFSLVNAQEWKAKWISTQECQSATNTWLAYRKTFVLDSIPSRAIAKIAVDSKYWMWINGQMLVFEGGLKRGPTPYDTYYDEFDIAPYLKPEKNTIAILVWYFGKDGFSHKSSGRAGLIFDCQSSGFNLFSDRSWKCSVIKAYKTAGEPFPNFRLPESNILYDARQDPGPWQTENFNDNSIPSAIVLGDAGGYPWNKLMTRVIPMFKDLGLKNYDNQNRITVPQGTDTIICKLPYNAQITPYLKVEATEGKRITICTDNYLHYNGGADLLRAEYITRNGVQEYESFGWMNGHKVYYLIPEGVRVLELKYRETGYNAEFAGSFFCTDPFFNKLWDKAARSLYITMRDNYMDCPDRERAQWTGDAVNETGESFYALSTSSSLLSKKWLYELLGWQKSDGSLFAPIPSGNWTFELPCQVLSSIGYYGLWTYYQYTGDKQTIMDLYDGAKRYLDLWVPDGNGTVKLREGDWTWGDWGENRDLLLIYNLWYYLAIKGMYNISLELGKTDDAIAFEKNMTNFKSAFNKQFWNGSSYRSLDYKGRTDDRVHALAVVAGIANEDKFPAIVKVFRDEENSSPYMEKYVFEAMMQMKYEREAMDRHKKRFSGMVNHSGFTTLFEGWGIGSEGFGGGTVNHAWSGGGLTILSQYVCGIAPIKPGFELFQIMPQPGSLTKASATMESVKGTIRSSFEIQNSTMLIKATVPPFSKAIVGVPSTGVKQIILNGKIVWKTGKYLKNFDIDPVFKLPSDRICFQVNSGDWSFLAQYK